MEILGSARRHGLADDDILHGIANAVAIDLAHDDGIFLIGPDPSGRLLEILAHRTPDERRVPRHATDPKVPEAIPAMTTRRPSLAERLAPMSIAEIESMTDDEAAHLMGASPAEIAAAVAAGQEWSWREAAKVATDEWHDRLAVDIEAGSASVQAEGPALERFRRLAADESARRSGGRPRLGNGHSVQIRARVSPDLARSLENAEARTGRPRSQIVRDALEA